MVKLNNGLIPGLNPDVVARKRKMARHLGIAGAVLIILGAIGVLFIFGPPPFYLNLTLYGVILTLQSLKSARLYKAGDSFVRWMTVLFWGGLVVMIAPYILDVIREMQRV